MGLIYKATFSNGKSYIGQTTQTLQKRKQQHKDKSKLNNNAFYHAIKKYGWDDITGEVIEDIEDYNKALDRTNKLLELQKNLQNASREKQRVKDMPSIKMAI